MSENGPRWARQRTSETGTYKSLRLMLDSGMRLTLAGASRRRVSPARSAERGRPGAGPPRSASADGRISDLWAADVGPRRGSPSSGGPRTHVEFPFVTRASGVELPEQ